MIDQHFTHFWAAEELVADAMRGLGDVSAVEPSCGTGAFLAAIPRSCAAFGVELDPSLVAQAVANSGREVVVGDFRTVDLVGRTVELVVGNPPFKTDIIDGFFDRAHALLPEGGVLAMILPATVLGPTRVMRWQERFAVDVKVIPRTLFGHLRTPIVWAKCQKTGERRIHGLMLFAEQRDIEGMRPAMRAALEGPGTWREVVRMALESLGGAASLQAIYDRILPARRVGPNWQPKVRQILQEHFRHEGPARWALP